MIWPWTLQNWTYQETLYFSSLWALRLQTLHSAGQDEHYHTVTSTPSQVNGCYWPWVPSQVVLWTSPALFITPTNDVDRALQKNKPCSRIIKHITHRFVKMSFSGWHWHLSSWSATKSKQHLVYNKGLCSRHLKAICSRMATISILTNLNLFQTFPSCHSVFRCHNSPSCKKKNRTKK